MRENDTYTRRATDLKLGESSVIYSFENKSFSAKFMEIGCLPNSPIKLVRKGPTGQTLYMRINNVAYAFRKEEAHHILLKY